MSDPGQKKLDDALQSLPREMDTSRDLWPHIKAAIEADPVSRSRSKASASVIARGRPSPLLNGWVQLAAGVTLMIVTSVTTYVVTRQSVSSELMAKNFISRSFDASTLGPDYLRARADLDRLFAERIASLPPDTRVKLQNNLADLRRAADEIAATLAERPTDSLLQELLISTRRRELQLLADISQLALPNS